MIKRVRRRHPYCCVRTTAKSLPSMFSLVKNESERFEDDQIPS